MQAFQHPEGWQIHLFIQKHVKEDETRFYYLGQVTPDLDTIRTVQRPIDEAKKVSLVEMQLKLQEPVETSLYHYLVSDEEENDN